MRNLTAMQAAYWSGRGGETVPDGVSAHLYAEFDGDNIDPARLDFALQKLLQRHPALRLSVTAEGQQYIPDKAPALCIGVEDLRSIDHQKVVLQLKEKRRQWTENKLNLSAGETCAFGLTLLDGGRFRLHVDTDMIAIDPSSFRVMMEDLAAFYEAGEDAFSEPAPSFFSWLDALKAEEQGGNAQKKARLWWQDNIPGIADAPALPKPQHDSSDPVRSDRLSCWLSESERAKLEKVARSYRITSATLLLSLFSHALGAIGGSTKYRLNVPMFWRAPVLDNVESIIGEFANVLLLNVDLETPRSLIALCRDISAQMRELIAHSAYPGVNVMRDLSRHHGALQLAPVVFTVGVDMPNGDLFSKRVERVFGKMNWVISQAPHVMLDVQVADVDNGLLINWDVRVDQISRKWIEQVFAYYTCTLKEIANRPQSLGQYWENGLHCSTGNGASGLMEDETCQMLLILWQRMAPKARIAADTPFDSVGLGAESIGEFFAFLGRYLPSCPVSEGDLEIFRTPRQFAAMLVLRSGGKVRNVAEAFSNACA